MIYQAIQQDIDLWEAWIEFDPVAQHFFGTLYVMGEVVVDKKSSRPFIGKAVNENEPHVLILHLQSPPVSHANRVTEVMYSENLKHIDQYRSIKIYKDHELLTRITDIETVVS